MRTVKQWFLLLLLLLVFPVLVSAESADGAVIYETAQDVKAAVSALIESGASEMELQCSEALFQSLFRQGGMYRLMNELGYEDFTLQGNSKHQLFLSNLKKMSVPYAQVSSVSEAGEKIAVWHLEGVPAFNLLYDAEAVSTLTRDDYRLMAFLGGMENYSYGYNFQTGLISFTDVVYTDVPGAYCTSEEEIVTTIRAMGARGVKAFQLMLDETTYDAVYANRFARLFELQAQAGMTDSDLRYSSSSRMLIFENAIISSDVQILNTLGEVTAHVEACVANGDSDISLLISADTYNALMEGAVSLFASDAKFYDLIANAGIMTVDDISFNRAAGAINLRGVHCYAGTNMLRALKNGNTSVLTDREQQALAAAQQLAADCKRDTPVETAKAIHDALCAMIVYTDDEATDEDDCCIGALLNGQANCDGYADAFLLTGKLAGLNVRYQHGDSLKGGFGSMFSTHMWNLIELDGSWRMVDVTWDDTESGVLYQWFNIGQDRAARSHVWSAEMSVPMQAETDPYARPVPEYFVSSADEVTSAARHAQTSGHQVFDLYVTEESGLGMVTTREAALQGLTGTIRVIWMDSLLCMHVELLD